MTMACEDHEPQNPWLGSRGHYKFDEMGQLVCEATVFSIANGHASVVGTNGKTIYPSKVGFAVSDQPREKERQARRRGVGNQALSNGSVLEATQALFVRVTFPQTRTATVYRNEVVAPCRTDGMSGGREGVLSTHMVRLDESRTSYDATRPACEIKQSDKSWKTFGIARRRRL